MDIGRWTAERSTTINFRAAMSNNVFSPGSSPTTVRSADGNVVNIPAGWELLSPGDPMLTRRVKADGEHWVIQEKRGRKIFSRGVLAPAATIARLRVVVESERSLPQYAKRKQADAQRRDQKQSAYVVSFENAVLEFLDFAAPHASVAALIARAVAAHATPVGSGTVARTQRIPVEQRAEAAVIAWMRHETTAYDSMKIARIKGERRQVRRELAQRSLEVLKTYRLGLPVPEGCPLQRALAKTENALS
jgi:hypothetical protein